MDVKEAVIELALVSAGTIVDRVLGDNPDIGSAIQIPIGGPYTINAVGLGAGAVAVALPFVWKSPSNKYAIHFLTGMFADAVGVFGEMAYGQPAVAYYEEPAMAQWEEPAPFASAGSIKAEGPFLQKVARALPKRVVTKV